MTAKKSSSSRKRSRPVAPRKTNPNIKIIGILVVITIAVIIAVAVLHIGNNTEGNQDNNTPSGNRIAAFNTTKGIIRVELYEDKAPITTGNFINLTNEGFYNGLIFHRVISGFMIQSGCPYGTGTGGPGYSIPDEFHEDLKHDSVGMLSMANSGPNTGGSQFFITVAETPWLDGKHSVFGKVIDGMDVVYTISEVETDGNDKPLEDVTINSITIENQ
ncbi:MAG: peptidylprolyl isomerase [Candidatus Thermoplasmatota archaeon]|nr:peptidylprolyl isomerase [Candidatus Thermoplasmatota archaeon]